MASEQFPTVSSINFHRQHTNLLQTGLCPWVCSIASMPDSVSMQLFLDPRLLLGHFLAHLRQAREIFFILLRHPVSVIYFFVLSLSKSVFLWSRDPNLTCQSLLISACPHFSILFFAIRATLLGLLFLNGIFRLLNHIPNSLRIKLLSISSLLGR